MEIITQLDYVREWEANFAVCIPKVKVLKKMTEIDLKVKLKLLTKIKQEQNMVLCQI